MLSLDAVFVNKLCIYTSRFQLSKTEIMPFVYDGLPEICRDHENLITWLREKELLGDFSGPCLK